MEWRKVKLRDALQGFKNQVNLLWLMPIRILKRILSQFGCR
jgi:hypothetical protein